jgi:hypothetical protein
VEPLQRIAQRMFPELETTLTRLQTRLAQGEVRPPEAALVVDQADQILLAMDQVLQKMIELGDYADLVNIVRSILQEQEGLIDRTKDEQKRRALELLK